jgi:Mn-containing catalase
MLKPTPGIVDEYFNGSTGDGSEGDTDMRGPWTTMYGLHVVDPKLDAPGGGLSVQTINGKIEGEDRGKQDEAQKATTSPGEAAIGKKGVGKGKTGSKAVGKRTL